MQPITQTIDPNSYRVQTEQSLFETAKPDLGRNDFMQLLVAQLENQNPLEPQQDAEFVAQLATFSSLEQLVDMNSRIDSMLDGQEQLVNSQSLNLIGREVLADTGGELQVRSDGGVEAVVVDLPQDIPEARVEIYDPSGALVQTVQLGDTSAGRHEVQWDGLDEDGNQWAPGMYGFKVIARGADGVEQTLPGFVSVPVEGLHVGANGLAFVSGNRVMTFDEVLEIRVAGQSPPPPAP